jgi:hypothetical protein
MRLHASYHPSLTLGSGWRQDVGIGCKGVLFVQLAAGPLFVLHTHVSRKMFACVFDCGAVGCCRVFSACHLLA